MANTKQTNTLATLRHEAVNSITRSYGALREYAIGLNATFSNDWFEVEHTDKSEEAKPILAEKLAFYKELREGLHTNPSVVWKRVCEFGKVERYGEPEANTESESIEGEQGESGKENANRSPMLRNVEELTTLYKFNARQENLDPKIIEAQKFIGKAIEALGIKLNMVDTSK